MKFEELYKKSRQNQQFTLDEDKLWSEIEKKLEKPKRRKVFFWFWGLCIGILIGSVSILYFYSPLVSSENSIISFTESLETKNEESSPKNNYLQNDSFEDNTNNKDFSTVQKKNSKIKEVSNEKTPEIVSHNSLNNSKSPMNLSNIFKLKNERIKKSNNQNSSFLSQDLNQKRNHENLEKADLIPLTKFIQSRQLIFIHILPINIKIVSISKNDAPNLTIDPILNHKNKNLKNIEFSFAMSYLKHSSTSKPINEINDSWNHLHESSKSSSLGLEFDFIFRHKHSSGFSIGMGPRARILTEWYDATVQTTSPATIQSDSAAYFQTNGIKEYIPGIITGIAINKVNYHTPIRRLYIDLPIELGYSIELNQIRLESSFSYNFNLLHSYFGRSNNKDLVLLNTSELKNKEVYNKNFVNSYNYNIGLSYNLTKNYSLGIDFKYWHQISSSINSNQMIDEKYNGYGVGVKYYMKL